MEKALKLGLMDAVLTSEEGLTVQSECLEEIPGVWMCHLVFNWPQKVHPKPVSLHMHHPCREMCFQWDPLIRQARFMPWIETKAFESRLASWIPMLAFASKTGRSRLTLALSDVKTPIRLSGDVGWPHLDVTCKLTFFTGVISPISRYEVVLRMDHRDLAFDESIREITHWYASLNYGHTRTPDAAYLSAYSTWYAYKRDVYAQQILEECRAAKTLGMDVVIVDDGWQNVETITDYSYCGDWTPAPNRFPDMRAFVREVHDIRMKVLLWFPISFIGMKAAAHARFAGKYLYDRVDRNCSVLDPRYPEVRQFIVETFVHAVKAWELDGLKIDYIDRFCNGGDPVPGMDFVSVEDATEALLSELHKALTAINPDIMLEFRQPYIGPVIGSYGNMFRIRDCPMDSATNRLSIAELRLTTYKAAVHSDMVFWDQEDSDESVAVSLYSTLFGVPQISMRLQTISPSHRQVLASFLAFRNLHIDTLMKGEFLLREIDSNYGKIQACSGSERITLLSSAPLMELGDYADEYVINLTEQTQLIVTGQTEGVCYEIFDCRGACISHAKKLEKNEYVIPFPTAARIHFIRQKSPV